MGNRAINTSESYFSLFTRKQNVMAEERDADESKNNQADVVLLAEALKCALDIRKFEIDLYWKRASYFWVLIGAALVAYVAVAAKGEDHMAALSVVVSCLGFVFSCAWLAVNKGSKFWQENWEKHVDMLEDMHMGPLYKIVFDNNQDLFSLGGGAYSVSKVNLIVSFYVVVLWFCLLVASLVYIWYPSLIRNYVAWLITFGAVFSIAFCCYLLLSDICRSRIDFLGGSENAAKAILRQRPLE